MREKGFIYLFILGQEINRHFFGPLGVNLHRWIISGSHDFWIVTTWTNPHREVILEPQGQRRMRLLYLSFVTVNLAVYNWMVKIAK